MSRHAKGEDTGQPGGVPAWQAGMRVRGGRVTHTVARAGWLAFAMVGAAIGVAVAAIYAASPGEHGADNSPAANFVGGMILFVPIGAVVFGLLGLAMQFTARAWLRTAPPKISRRERRAQVLAERLDEAGLRPSSTWARHYESCARSVMSFHDIVNGMAGGAARDWFTDVGSTLDSELAEALRLARLGDSLETSGDGQLSPTASRTHELLKEAVTSFARTTDRAAGIALDLRDDSDFVRVRAQLDMLAQQAPQLRAH